MNNSTTTYRLGEVVTDDREMPMTRRRYVHVVTLYEGLAMMSDRITLPEAEAHRLCDTMNPSIDKVVAMLQENVDEQNRGDGLTHWMPPHWLVPIISALRVLAHQNTAWLGHITCKYINVRIDMRDGHFTITDGMEGKSAENTLISMLKKAMRGPKERI